MRGDFKDEARRFEDIDRAAQKEAEDRLALEAVAAKYGNAKCVVCGVRWVDVANGFDTCEVCQPREQP